MCQEGVTLGFLVATRRVFPEIDVIPIRFANTPIGPTSEFGPMELRATPV